MVWRIDLREWVATATSLPTTRRREADNAPYTEPGNRVWERGPAPAANDPSVTPG